MKTSQTAGTSCYRIKPYNRTGNGSCDMVEKIDTKIISSQAPKVLASTPIMCYTMGKVQRLKVRDL